MRLPSEMGISSTLPTISFFFSFIKYTNIIQTKRYFKLMCKTMKAVELTGNKSIGSLFQSIECIDRGHKLLSIWLNYRQKQR
jgi:hypothetical protein